MASPKRKKDPIIELNQERVTYNESLIRNMKLFSEEYHQQAKTVVSEQPYQIDILQVHQDRVYVASSEK